MSVISRATALAMLAREGITGERAENLIARNARGERAFFGADGYQVRVRYSEQEAYEETQEQRMPKPRSEAMSAPRSVANVSPSGHSASRHSQPLHVHAIAEFFAEGGARIALVSH